MVPFSFNIERPKDIKATFKKLKERIEKENGSLSGDGEKGTISSDGVEGTYIVKTDFVEITIHKKPLPFIPNSLVEKEIRGIFSEISSS